MLAIIWFTPILIQKESATSKAFDNVYSFLKNELQDIEAFQDVMSVKGNYDSAKEKCQNKVRELENDLQKCLAGKTTLKSIFSKGNKEEMVANIEKNIEAVPLLLLFISEQTRR